VAVVAHPIFLVSHGVFAFARFMAVVSTLALALILGHLVPRGILVCLSGKAPSSRPNEIQRDAASSQVQAPANVLDYDCFATASLGLSAVEFCFARRHAYLTVESRF